MSSEITAVFNQLTTQYVANSRDALDRLEKAIAVERRVIQAIERGSPPKHLVCSIIPGASARALRSISELRLLADLKNQHSEEYQE